MTCSRLFKSTAEEGVLFKTQRVSVCRQRSRSGSVNESPAFDYDLVSSFMTAFVISCESDANKWLKEKERGGGGAEGRIQRAHGHISV